MHLAFKAVAEHNMIEEGDKILLGISGGKDSLSLLHVFAELQRKLPQNFEFFACTVDPQTPSYNPQPLIKYCEKLNVKYHFLSEDIIGLAKQQCDGKGATSICSFCSRIKRGMIYSCMRKNGYNKLAFGQHLDDLAESFFMAFLHNGALNTMKANYVVDKGDLSMIRPLIYVRESALKKFAYESKLPIIPENCPGCFKQPQERQRIKELIASQEILFPDLFSNLLRAMKPLYSQRNLKGREAASGTQGPSGTSSSSSEEQGLIEAIAAAQSARGESQSGERGKGKRKAKKKQWRRGDPPDPERQKAKRPSKLEESASEASELDGEKNESLPSSSAEPEKESAVVAGQNIDETAFTIDRKYYGRRRGRRRNNVVVDSSHGKVDLLDKLKEARASAEYENGAVTGPASARYATTLRALERAERQLIADGMVECLVSLSQTIGQELRSNDQASSLLDLVVYGLGSPVNSATSRLQTAALKLLMDELAKGGGDPVSLINDGQHIVGYDPVWSSLERDLLREYCGLACIAENEAGWRRAHRTTLFFMPHCGKALFKRVLAANLSRNPGQNEQQHAVMVLGNSLQRYLDQPRPDPALMKLGALPLACRELPQFTGLPASLADAFNDTSLHVFDCAHHAAAHSIDFEAAGDDQDRRDEYFPASITNQLQQDKA